MSYSVRDNKCIVCPEFFFVDLPMAGIQKIVRLENMEDPDQSSSTEAV